jgi:hypothetical protein
MTREEDLQYKITAAFEAINLYELGNMSDYRYDPKTALAYSIRKGAIAAEHLGDIESKFKLYEKAREHGVFEEVFSGVESLRDDEVDPAIRLNPGVRPWKPPGVMEMKLTKTKLNKLINEALEQEVEEGSEYDGDDSILEHFHGATLEEGDLVCEACLFETLHEASCGCPDLMGEAEYQGRKVTLNKPTRGDVKKFKVYVKDPKTGNVKKVNFGDKNMRIKKSNPKRRKSFRARHNCKNPGPKTKARYWSCKKW